MQLSINISQHVTEQTYYLPLIATGTEDLPKAPHLHLN